MSIIKKNIEDEVRASYLDYSMSVIVSRALPDVCDGLKPVHRRILFAMLKAGFHYDKPYRKSARVVGDVIGIYHPHSNEPVYEAMVRLAQDFSMRLPLIDGQGNFGSMDGDPAASFRYTEARLAKCAQALLDDIDKNTVDFQPNYDNSTVEPKVLPARFPNILVNGANGIAVGMATNVPPHNLSEVIDACIHMIENPECTVLDLMKIVPAPDFPTGGVIIACKGLRDSFETGRGSFNVRSLVEIEQSNRTSIIIKEIPYQVNKAKLVEQIAAAVNEGTVEGVYDVRDESNRNGVRVVIDLKKDAQSSIVLNQMYRHTNLQVSFSSNMVVLNHGRPETLGLADIIREFLSFRKEVIIRRTRFEFQKLKERGHILLGFIMASSNIDRVVEIIKGSPDPATARERLIQEKWDAIDIIPYLEKIEGVKDSDQRCYLTDAQARAILALQLQRLTAMEQRKITSELDEIAVEMSRLIEILSSFEKIMEAIKSELLEVKALYGSPRRTVVSYDIDSDMLDEDFITKEDMVVTVSLTGYIKRVPLSSYRTQKRGGRGRSGMSTDEEDLVQKVFVANTHTKILFFTSLGRVYELPVFKLPCGSPQSKGRAIINLLPLSGDETIAAIMPVPEELLAKCVMFITKNGKARKNSLSDFRDLRKGGKNAIRLKDDDRLVDVIVCSENEDIFIATAYGRCLRFSSACVRCFVGRDSDGVRAMKLSRGDFVVSASTIKNIDTSAEERERYLRAKESEQGLIAQDRFEFLKQNEQFILSVASNGYGKITSAYEYRESGRDGSGIINMNLKGGEVVSSFPIDDSDEIILITDQGQLIRLPVEGIRVCGRATLGVTLFKLSVDERVVSIGRIAATDKETEQ